MGYIRRTIRHQQKKKINTTMAVAATIVTTTQISPLLTHTAHAASYQQEFINKIGETARQVANENDLYASIMIAQAILESNWGRSGLSQSANNYFGIKGKYQGQSVVMNTAEQKKDGTVYYIDEPFRKYPSIRESLLDYVALLKGTRYYAGAWKSNTTSYQQATKHLTGRYATAINYNTVLNNIIATYNLTKYDTPTTNRSAVTQSTVSSSASSNVTTYTVKRGDSVWAIANRFNMTMSEVITLNNIKNNFIYPGQVLRVTGQQTTSTTTVTPRETVKTVSQSVQTATPVTSQATSAQQTTYTVKAGDSVWKIANKFGVSMNSLRSLNNIKNNFIYPGQQLTITANKLPQTIATVSTPVTTPTASNQQTTYTVKAGDSVWRIANKFGVSMDTLRSLNNIKNNFIYPGQVLTIR